jgi:hypothetical protein
MIFAEDLNSRNILEIPFIAKKEYFDAYFKDILTCIQKASESRQGDRLGTMRSEWRQYWLTWIASEKIKEYANAFQEWGTIIANTKDTVIKMIDIISPVFKGISTALKAAS